MHQFWYQIRAELAPDAYAISWLLGTALFVYGVLYGLLWISKCVSRWLLLIEDEKRRVAERERILQMAMDNRFDPTIPVLPRIVVVDELDRFLEEHRDKNLCAQRDALARTRVM